MPIPFQALGIFVLMRWLKFSFSSKYKPKCFWQEVRAIGELLKVTAGWSTLDAFRENNTSWASLDRSGLKGIFHW